MTRVKRGKKAASKHKHYLKISNSYRGTNSISSTLSMEQISQSLFRLYISRKLKKRNFKYFWINHINSQIKQNNLKFSSFFNILKKKLVYSNIKNLTYIEISTINLLSRL